MSPAAASRLLPPISAAAASGASRPKRSDNMLHLVRLDDTGGTHGWQLRIPSWHPYGPYTVYFADSKYASPANALKAARRERDRVFKEAGLPLRPHGHRPAGPPGRRNESGLTGVFLQAQEGGGYLTKHWSWVALWSESGVARKRTFSVSTQGFEGAFWLAVELRQKRARMLFSNDELRDALARGRERMGRG